MDLEGSVSLVGPPFLCCKQKGAGYNPLFPERSPWTPALLSPANTSNGSSGLQHDGLGLREDPEARPERRRFIREVIPRNTGN